MKFTPQKFVCGLAVSLAFFSGYSPAVKAQNQPDPDNEAIKTHTPQSHDVEPHDKVETLKKPKRYQYKTIPYINYGRNFGGMAGVVPLFIFKTDPNDKISPDSLAGGWGVYTSNDTWSVGGFAKLFLDDDKWRATIAAGTGTINSQYVDPVFSHSIDYAATTDFATIEVNRAISKHHYLGLNYVYSKFENTFDTPTPAPITSTSKLHGFGIVFDADTRKNNYYPKHSHHLNARFTTYPGKLSNSTGSSLLKVKLNNYTPMRGGKDVLAARIFTGAGFGDITFNKELIVARVDLRGYTQGDYRGQQMVAAQAEYRLNLDQYDGKLGFVGFAGLGSVFGSVIEENNGEILPSVGAGVRYKIFPKNHLNVGMDIAAGRDDWGLTFRIGEAF